MDAGVGSFVLLHGLCSSHRKCFPSKRKGLKKCFLSSFPLFLLGFIRLAATTAVGYHKVVPEYGIHWNFFFTLAFTKMICYSVLCSVRIPAGLLALVTVTLHQYLLSGAGLADLVLSDQRTTFFEANKEGICSLLGFVTLYFCGVQLGHVVWKEGINMKEYVKLLLKLCGIGIFSWFLMYEMHEHIQYTSRRMANLAYCVWVVSLTTLQIGVHLFQEIVTSLLSNIFKNNYFEPRLWKIINYNGLFYFLLANLLTGLVNLAIKTDECSDFVAVLVLMLYLGILTTFTALLYKYSLQLKFW